MKSPLLLLMALTVSVLRANKGASRSQWRVPCLLLAVAAGHLVATAEALSPKVETRPATSLGTTAFTANGKIHPHRLPTIYYFEYGPSARYGSKTTEQPLPPRLAAFYAESFAAGLGGWLGGMNGKDLAHHHSTERPPKGFARFSEPSGHDPNHDDGIGTLHLASYFYPSTHPNPDGLRALLAGGAPDLRDARVKLTVRGNQWIPNGTECVWWTQSDHQPGLSSGADWRRANWAYTGFSLNDFLASGRWEKVEYRLNNDSHDWTYGGNNLSQKRPNYAYDSIDHSQSHVSCDFFHLVAGVDPKNPPRGSIDFADFELAYRNYSLLLPSNGGKLVSSPAGSTDDPAKLTDGWRHGADRMWRSGPNPAAPLEFHYEFAHPVNIQRVQFHQQSDWPSKGMELLISEDGSSWKTLYAGDLPEHSPSGPNFAFLFKDGLNANARSVRVRILSGYKAEHWGLGEIEIFGSGAAMQTDDDWYHVNQDVVALRPGETYHYRLVTRNAAGTAHGEDQTFTVPADRRPHLEPRPPSRITGTSAKLEGRLNALGQSTHFYFEYGPDTNYGHKTAPQYGGLQITPRTASANLTGLKPGALHHYRLVASNETGTTYGADMTFATKPKAHQP